MGRPRTCDHRGFYVRRCIRTGQGWRVDTILGILSYFHHVSMEIVSSLEPQQTASRTRASICSLERFCWKARTPGSLLMRGRLRPRTAWRRAESHRDCHVHPAPASSTRCAKLTRVVSRSWWKLGGAGPEVHGGVDQAARSRSVGEWSRVGQPSTRRMVI